MIRKTLLLATLSMSCFSVFAGSWADDWFDSATYSESGSFNTQKRGYISGGSFSGRLNLSNDYLMSVQSPRISAGCGGIDGFLGGVSFLDEDYLVQKFQNIMQAAPAVAFDMALKTVCKECAETIAKLEAATNFLNGIQLNECALAKKTVAVLQPDDPTTLSDMWTEMSGEESLSAAMDRNWQETKESMQANDNKPIIDLKTTVESCPTALKNIFNSGSLVGNMATQMGMEDYAPLVRGFVGDVVVSNNPAQLIPTAAEVSPCGENEGNDIKAMLYGYAQQKAADGTCSNDNSEGGVLGIVQDNLEAIGNKMKSGVALTESEQNFITRTSTIPVYSMLSTALKNGTLDDTIASIDEVVALGYSYYMMDSLYNNTSRMFREARKALGSATYDPQSCNIKLYTPQIEKFKGVHERLEKTKESVRQSFIVETQNYQTVLNQQIVAQKQSREASSELARSLQ